MEDQSMYETSQSMSSRGSRITANLASFFKEQTAADNELEERQMAERARQQAVQQKQQLARAASSTSSAAAAVVAGAGTVVPAGAADRPRPTYTPTEPASGLVKPATDQLPRLDSDGFEIDDDDDDVMLNNAAVARQVVTATGTPAAAGGEGDVITPHPRTSSAGGGLVTSLRPTPVQSASNIASSTVNPSRSAAVPEVSGLEAEASLPSVKGAAPVEVAAAAARQPHLQAQPQHPRRTTGKTGFIRDWLGSAEPAPGEGPSIALFNNGEIDDGDTAQVPGPTVAAPRHASRLETVPDEKEADEEVEKAAERDSRLPNLSKSTHSDLRTVLEKDRINAESDSHAQEVEERESASVAAATAARVGGGTPSADTEISRQGRKSAANRAMNTLFRMQSSQKGRGGAGPGVEGGRGQPINGVQGEPVAALPQSDMHAYQAVASEESVGIKVRSKPSCNCICLYLCLMDMLRWCQSC
jgi:hypothetical protein